MKRIGFVLFAIFYVAASVHVVSERSTRLAELLERASGLGAKEADCSCSRDPLPRFSHAKKTGPNVAEIPLEFHVVTRIVVCALAEVQDAEYGFSFDAEVNNSRAPPALI
jgi:hypothetical protein